MFIFHKTEILPVIFLQIQEVKYRKNGVNFIDLEGQKYDTAQVIHTKAKLFQVNHEPIPWEICYYKSWKSRKLNPLLLYYQILTLI